MRKVPTLNIHKKKHTNLINCSQHIFQFGVHYSLTYLSGETVKGLNKTDGKF